MNKIFFLFFLFFISGILFFYFGCKKEFIFEKEISIVDSAWNYNNILKFDFEINDISKKYDLMLEVIHAGDYDFQNLYVKFQTAYPSGEKKEQVVSLELAGKSGIWNGQCSGNTCAVEIPLQVNAIFEEKGKHQISIEQYMRKSPLRGVEGMALKIKVKE